MKTTQETISSALTAVSARPTRAQPLNTKAWADWLRIDLHSDAEIAKMVDKCAEFALALKSGGKPRWISLLGNSGVGKTHCGKRLWNYAVTFFKWHPFEFIHGPVYWPDFVKQLRSGHVYNRVHEMQKWPVLFLDDIGAERDTTGFAAEQLNALVGSREGKWTIITSNLLMEQIAAIDPRIADRIIRPPNLFVKVETESHAIREVQSRQPYKD